MNTRNLKILFDIPNIRETNNNIIIFKTVMTFESLRTLWNCVFGFMPVSPLSSRWRKYKRYSSKSLAFPGP